MPILFSGEMVRAILEGRKTQARRVMKPQPEHVSSWSQPIKENPGYLVPIFVDDDGTPRSAVVCPYGQKLGDCLWVRETCLIWTTPGDPGNNVIYADDPEWGELLFDKAVIDAERKQGHVPSHVGNWKKTPSIHMPRWASRITLEIVSIRVERLQDISEEDAKAEGCGLCDTGLECTECAWLGWEDSRWVKRVDEKEDWHYLCPICKQITAHHPIDEQARMEYRKLWDSLNAKRGFCWDVNPWVWAIEFKVV